jgi:hypothetical protein
MSVLLATPWVPEAKSLRHPFLFRINFRSLIVLKSDYSFQKSTVVASFEKYIFHLVIIILSEPSLPEYLPYYFLYNRDILRLRSWSNSIAIISITNLPGIDPFIV